MTYRVSVFTDEREIEHHSWYSNYRKKYKPFHYDQKNMSKYNAVITIDSPFLEFETEQDFLYFLLIFG